MEVGTSIGLKIGCYLDALKNIGLEQRSFEELLDAHEIRGDVSLYYERGENARSFYVESSTQGVNRLLRFSESGQVYEGFASVPVASIDIHVVNVLEAALFLNTNADDFTPGELAAALGAQKCFYDGAPAISEESLIMKLFVYSTLAVNNAEKIAKWAVAHDKKNVRIGADERIDEKVDMNEVAAIFEGDQFERIRKYPSTLTEARVNVMLATKMLADIGGTYTGKKAGNALGFCTVSKEVSHVCGLDEYGEPEKASVYEYDCQIPPFALGASYKYEFFANEACKPAPAYSEK